MSVDGANRLALAAYCLLALAVLLRDREPAPASRPDPRVAIPQTNELLVTLRLSQLRHTPLGQSLRELFRPQQAPGWDDPACSALEELDEVALALPRLEAGLDLASFQVALASPLPPSDWERCARRLAQARGAELHVSHHGGYRRLTLEPPHDEAGDAARGQLAMRDDGLLLWGASPQVEAMIATASLHTPSVRTAADHRVLREIVGVHGALLVSWSGAPSPLLPGVRAAALRVDMGERVELSLVLRCVSEASCQVYLESLRALAASRGDDAALHDQGEVVRLWLSVPSSEAERAVSAWLASDPEPALPQLPW